MIAPFKDDKFKKYLLQVTLIFCGALIFGMVCGYFMPHNMTYTAVSYVFNDSASAKIVSISDNDGLKSLLYFVNNSIVAALLMVIPLLYYNLLGKLNDPLSDKWRIEPIWISKIMLSLQTLLIGVVIGFIAPIRNNNLLVITSILPHGIVEIPASLIACAIGIWFIQEKYVQEIGYRGVVKLFAIYVLPLLFLAAMLETYVTPFLMSFAV